MKNSLILGLIFMLLGCSPKIVDDINYAPEYINKIRVEEGIKNQGVKLTMSSGYSNGKGLLSIKDSDSDEKEESTFTIVKKEVKENGEIMIINAVPTIEGNYEVIILIKNNKQKSSFRIVENWQNKIEFVTISSSVKMNKPINSNGLTFVEMSYKGQQKNNERVIELKNEFYLEVE